MITIMSWLVFSALVAIIASFMNRRGWVWFLVSAVISPLIGLVCLGIAGKSKVNLNG